jgi:hypothetical protein
MARKLLLQWNLELVVFSLSLFCSQIAWIINFYGSKMENILENIFSSGPISLDSILFLLLSNHPTDFEIFGATKPFH